MKRITFIILSLSIISLLAYSQNKIYNSVPDGKYYFKANNYSPTCVEKYTFENNELISLPYGMPNMGTGVYRYKYTSRNNDWFIFELCRMETFPNFNTMKPETIFTPQNKFLYISRNLQTLNVNDRSYNGRCTKEYYDNFSRNFQQHFGGGGSAGSSTSVGSSSTDKSSTRSKDCKYCNGTGRCKTCNGRGVTFNSYSGHNDDCPTCFGRCRCFNCYGTGKQ